MDVNITLDFSEGSLFFKNALTVVKFMSCKVLIVGFQLWRFCINHSDVANFMRNTPAFQFLKKIGFGNYLLGRC